MNGMGGAKGTGVTRKAIKQNLFNKPLQQGQVRSRQQANSIPYQVPGQAAKPEIGAAPAPAPDERFKYKYNPKPGEFRMTPENQAKYEQSAVPMWDGFNTKPQTNLYTENGMPNALFGVTTLKGLTGPKTQNNTFTGMGWKDGKQVQYNNGKALAINGASGSYTGYDQNGVYYQNGFESNLKPEPFGPAGIQTKKTIKPYAPGDPNGMFTGISPAGKQYYNGYQTTPGNEGGAHQAYSGKDRQGSEWVNGLPKGSQALENNKAPGVAGKNGPGTLSGPALMRWYQDNPDKAPKVTPAPPSEPMSAAAYAAKFYTPFTPEQAAKNEKDAALYKSDYPQYLANWKVDQAKNNANSDPSNLMKTPPRPFAPGETHQLGPGIGGSTKVHVAPPEHVGAKMNADGFTYNDPKTGRLIYTRPPVWNPETDGQEGMERTHRAKGGQFAMGLDGKMIPVLGSYPGAKK
jgi:hypothetical protein